MELKLCTYATVTTLGDFGPWISKVVLDLPCTVRANDIDTNTFHIYVERHERSGEVLMRKERGADHAAPSVGYIVIVGSLEGGGHAAVLNRVRIAHVVDKAADGMRREQKARREGDASAHKQKDAQVLADIAAQLARKTFCERCHCVAYQSSLAAGTGSALSSSSTMRPSRRRSTRFAMRAMAALWVTMMMVQP